jgi:hypothetical protein
MFEGILFRLLPGIDGKIDWVQRRSHAVFLSELGESHRVSTAKKLRSLPNEFHFGGREERPIASLATNRIASHNALNVSHVDVSR